MAPAFKRILLKLSGEARMGSREYGMDPERVADVARQVTAVHDQGVEVDCNTDFVAKNDDFIAFARDVAMQLAASPAVKYVSREDVPEDQRAAESRIYEQEAADKPENVRERIVSGKLDSWYQTVVALEQEMHNPKFEGKTVQQLRDELAATTGENVVIRRFARFAVGQ